MIRSSISVPRRTSTVTSSIVNERRAAILDPQGLDAAHRWVVAYCFLNAIPLLRAIPKAWATIVLIGFFASLFRARFLLAAWRRHTWLWTALGLTGASLAVYALISDQSIPREQLYWFLRACPFVLFGLVASTSEARLRNSLLAMTVGNAIAAGMDLTVNATTIAETGQVAGRFYHSVGDSPVDASLFSQNVLYWHSVMALGLSLALSLALFNLSQKRRRAYAVLVGSVGIITLTVLTAGFTAVVLVVAAGLGVVLIRERTRLRPSMILALALVAPVAVGALYLGRDLSPALDTVWNRLSTAGQVLVGSTSIEDADTSGRWGLAHLSWTTFVQSPFIGVVTGDVPFELLVGGHSSLVDVPALYGLAGSVGPFCLVGMALYQTRPRRTDPRGISVRKALFVFWVMYLVSVALDPVWLTAAIDFYVFFALGLTAGTVQEKPTFGVRPAFALVNGVGG